MLFHCKMIKNGNFTQRPNQVIMNVNGNHAKIKQPYIVCVRLLRSTAMTLHVNLVNRTV